MDFLFLCEISTREEKSYILICEELKRRGYTAEYRVSGDWEYSRFNANVLIANTAYTPKAIAHTIFLPAGRVKKFVSFRWEQISSVFLVSDEFEQLCNSGRSYNWLCWGDEYYNICLNAGIKKKFIHKVGPVFLDFLRPQFFSLFKSAEEIKKEFQLENKKILLHIDAIGPDEFTDSLFNEYTAIFGREVAEQIRIFTNKTDAELLKWFDIFLEENQEWAVVWRMHPGFQYGELIKGLEKKNTRFKTTIEYDLQQWIVIADMCVTVGSSSVAEVQAANKECVIAQPFGIIDEHDQKTYKNAKNIVHTYSDFSDSILKNKGSVIPDFDYYYDIEEKPSYIRICDVLEEIYQSNEYNIVWDQSDLNDAKKYAIYYKLKKTGYTCNRIARKFIKKGIKFILTNYNCKTQFGKKLKAKCDNPYPRNNYNVELQKKIRKVIQAD